MAEKFVIEAANPAQYHKAVRNLRNGGYHVEKDADGIDVVLVPKKHATVTQANKLTHLNAKLVPYMQGTHKKEPSVTVSRGDRVAIIVPPVTLPQEDALRQEQHDDPLTPRPQPVEKKEQAFVELLEEQVNDHEAELKLVDTELIKLAERKMALQRFVRGEKALLDEYRKPLKS